MIESIITGDPKLDEAVHRKDVLIAYCLSCMKAGDWHGVSDAANDIRCIDVELIHLRAIYNMAARR